MWMVRCGKKSDFINNFVEGNMVALGWQFGDLTDINEYELESRINIVYPENDSISNAFYKTMVWNFIHNIEINDYVVTYDSIKRLYYIGKVTSGYKYVEDENNYELVNQINVEWYSNTINRDDLPIPIKNKLNSRLAIFSLNDIQEYMLNALNGEIKVTNIVDDYNWIDFYMDFADKLLEYKNNRSALIEKVIHLWDNIDMNMPLLETNNEIVDMDPFTIFGLFNKKLTDENRISIIKYFKSTFDINADIPTTFPGIPMLSPQKGTFYFFKDERGYNGINNLWDLFECAIKYANNKNKVTRRKFYNSYNKVLVQKGIKWNITMALFWIRPYEFINLDSRSRWFLENPDNFNIEISEELQSLKEPPKAKKYLTICEKCNLLLKENNYSFKNLPELSNEAYLLSKEDDLTEKENSGDGIGDSDDENQRNYWLYHIGYQGKKWEKYYNKGIIGIGWGVIGDLTKYSDKKQIVKEFQRVNHDKSKYTNNSLALWQFANEMKPGDVVFAKRGRKEVLGYGIVESDYFYDKTLDKDHHHIRRVNWKEKGNWKYNGNLITKILTRITDYLDLVNSISNLFETSPEDEEEIITYPEYTADDFLKEVYMTNRRYNTLKNLLKYKKNIILQGAPGVGKTFISKRLAYSIIGCKDKSKVVMVQFHQSYNYEDFIMGYRPSNDGFELTNGVFYDFCKKAKDDEENDYFFIIDEINRGNLSKIFGELFMLIENDKRGSKNKIQLLYNDELFYIPSNVYIIGMMNTADRSLAMLDYALRRRFSFFELQPAFDSDNFRKYAENLNYEKFNKIIELIKELNNNITNDESLGKGFMIGHSYFTNLKKENINNQLYNIIEFEIIPLLGEYWFDEEEKVADWSNRLRSVLQ